MDIGMVGANGHARLHIESPRRVVVESKPLTTLSERKDDKADTERLFSFCMFE